MEGLAPVGGHLALEFTNTLSWDPNDPTAGETIETYPMLLDWSRERGLISRKTHSALAGKAQADPQRAVDVHREAVRLRAAMHEIFSALAGGNGVPEKETIGVLNEALAALPLRLSVGSVGASWDWASANDELASVLWPVVWSAASLLTSSDLPSVKQCAGDRCGWLFVDTSRRGNRKWCDMSDCGNRAKARRHYYRYRGLG